jgi:hypothetical protein
VKEIPDSICKIEPTGWVEPTEITNPYFYFTPNHWKQQKNGRMTAV